MTLRAPPFRVGILLLAVGLIAGLSLGVAALSIVGNFHIRGQRITVPAEVTLELDPAERIVVMRERAGPHVTVNNPLEDPPEDLAITVHDANDGATIPTEPNRWWMRQRLFGLERHRTGLVEFLTPAHGRVRVTVTGSFNHPQVYYVGPHVEAFQRTYATPLSIGAALAAILALAGVALIVWRAASLADIVSNDFE
jgi:hypothetical protein